VITTRAPVTRFPRRAALTVLVVLVSLAGAAACAGSPEVTARPPLRWGGDAEGGAPFVEADPSDPSKVRGFDVEVAEMIARGLGREPGFVQVQWASVEASVERGDFHMGLSGMEDRPELRARRSLSVPYFAFREVLAVRPADTARYRTLADLGRRRVGTLAATLAWQILVDEQRRTGLVPVSYDNDNHPYTDLVSGRVDAVLLDHIIAQRSLRRLGGFVIQPVPVATSHYVAMFARRDSALRDSASAVLRARMADGSLERTYRRWNIWDDDQRALFARILAAAPGDREREPLPSPGPPLAGPVPSASAASSAVNAVSVGAPAAGHTTIAAYLPALAMGAGLTLLISVAAMAIAIVLGTMIAAGRIYGGPIARAALTVYVEVMRGTPVLLQLFVIYYGLASVVRLPALAAAIIGLGLNYAAYEAEIYRGALQAVARSQLEAARTLGFSEWQALRLIRGPQALRYALAPMTNDFVALLKDSSLVSVITVVELTKQAAIYAVNVGSWLVPGALCAAAYLAMSLPLARAARALERRWGHAP
jgi:polar amino acid transport system substrate-binding protein